VGWARNRWVRWIAIVLTAWAAVDALISLRSVLFPRQIGPHTFRESWVTSTFEPYWNLMYPKGHPTIGRLTAVIRYGVTIAACLAVIWDIRPRSRRADHAAFELWQRENADLPSVRRGG
jgi:hypothetical protein